MRVADIPGAVSGSSLLLSLLHELLHCLQSLGADVMLDSFGINCGCGLIDPDRQEELLDNVVAEL